MEQQGEDEVLQEEVMEVGDPQGEVVESADVGQQPLEEVEKSPANQQGQSPVLGLTSPGDEIMSSPQKESLRNVEEQLEAEMGQLLPATASSMGSQVFSQPQ